MHFQNRSALALLILFLATISGCSTPQPRTIVVTETERVCPPQTLTDPTKAPPPLQEGDPWIATIDQLTEYKAALDRGNADKQAIRDFCE